MPDEYLLFSTAIEDLTKAETKWWVSTLADIDGEKGNPGFLDKSIDWESLEFTYGMHESHIWFISFDRMGSPEQLCALVQAFFKKFRPDGQFSMTWAETCSSPRTGAFAGGAAAVTKDTISWLDAGNWLDNEFDAIEAQAR